MAFRDKKPEEFTNPDLNPYLKLHRSFGPPVLTAEEAQGFAGRWAEAFGRTAPLHLEIGAGNGFYLTGMAQQVPDANWLGIEIRYKRVILCARKLRAAGVSNARIARYDAFHLDDLFAVGDLAGLHVNHPDPWPKDRHEQNRLLGPAFAAWAARALAPGGTFRLKTDFPGNVARLLDAVEPLPFALRGRSDDIVRDGAPWPDDVETNYQSKFRKRGEPVFALLLERLPG